MRLRALLVCECDGAPKKLDDTSHRGHTDVTDRSPLISFHVEFAGIRHSSLKSAGYVPNPEPRTPNWTQEEAGKEKRELSSHHRHLDSSMRPFRGKCELLHDDIEQLDCVRSVQDHEQFVKVKQLITS